MMAIPDESSVQLLQKDRLRGRRVVRIRLQHTLMAVTAMPMRRPSSKICRYKSTAILCPHKNVSEVAGYIVPCYARITRQTSRATPQTQFLSRHSS